MTTNGWTWKTNNTITEPLFWNNASYNGSSQPVVGVSWYEAVAFSNWLSVKEGLTPAYNILGQANLVASGYRLPTEVEWEYAAAKGASGLPERIYAYGGSVVGDWDANKVVGGSGETQPANVGSKSPAGGAIGDRKTGGTPFSLFGYWIITGTGEGDQTKESEGVKQTIKGIDGSKAGGIST